MFRSVQKSFKGYSAQLGKGKQQYVYNTFMEN